MKEKELRKRLRALADIIGIEALSLYSSNQPIAAYRLSSVQLSIVKLLTDYDEQPDPLKEHHPEIAKWYEKHGEKPAGIPVTSSVGVHTCYEGCTHPAHEGVPVPPIGTEPLADHDDAHQETKPAVNEELQEIVTEQLGTLGHGPVAEVWSHYVSAHPDHKTCRLTAPRKRMIQARLKEGYTVEQLKDAITGFHLSPFHTGENEQKKRYLEFELMVRSGEQVEKGLGCLRDARQPGKATGPSEAEIAAQEAEIRATVDAALAKPIPAPEAPPAPEKEEVEFLS